MYEFTLLIFAVAIMASLYLVQDAYKHRNLPIAQPLMYLSVVLVLLCATSFIEVLDIERQQWLNQIISDIRPFFLRPLGLLLWVWILLEYHYDKKIPFTHKIVLLCALLPLLTMTLFITHAVSQGFVSQTSTTALITPDEKGAWGMTIVRAYGAVIALGVILLTPYVVKKRQQSRYPWLEILLLMLMTILPYALLQMHRLGMIGVAYGALPNVFLLLWASRQYRLLDVLPVALQGVMDKVDSGILVSNLQSKMLYINDYAQQLLNLKVTTASLQQRDAELPDVFTQHFDFSKPEKQNALIQSKNQEGDTRYIDAVLQPIFHQTLHKHLGATVSLHDITKRKQAELELESFSRQKSEFFAGISHEFRTPLTLSMGGIEDVLEDTDPITPKQHKTLTQAKSNNQRLLSLVNQLLELSRLDKGSLSIKPAKIRLASYVPMLIANFESLAEKQHIRLHFLVSDEAQQDSLIYFDPDALDKVLINLISNALKSMDADTGGDVYVNLSQAKDGQLRLTVRDNGCGIPAEALSKIFDMFYSHQMDNPAWPPGTGVGLSLVKQLLLLHSSDIRVSSTEGQGSCFTVDLQRGYAHFATDAVINHADEWGDERTLPCTEQSQRAIQHTTSHVVGIDEEDIIQKPGFDPAQPSGENTNNRILLAEDNPDMRRYIRKHLTDFTLLEAPDGAAALELARQEIPDLILSDVMMPKMNGYDLCKNLKSDTQTSHIPVVLLTAKSDQSEKLEGLSLGADDYLSKPFDVRELNLRLNNLIKARQTLQTLYQTQGLAKVIQHPELPPRETEFLEQLCHYVLENLNNTDIKAAQLAEAVHMSERNLRRKLKAVTGDTPHKMLLTIRMEQAQTLLMQSDHSIHHLSYQVGFNDPSHFTRAFKTYFGMTPTQYREQQ